MSFLRTLTLITVLPAAGFLAAVDLSSKDSLIKLILARWNVNLPPVVSQVTSQPEAVSPAKLDPATLKTISELSVKSGDYQVPVAVKSDNKVLGLTIDSTKLIYLVTGKAKAGIDFNKITTQTTPTGTTYILPSPEILTVELQPEKSKKWDYVKGIFGPETPELVTEAMVKGKEDIRAAACQNELLKQVNEQAVKVFELYMHVTPITTPPGQCQTVSTNPTDTGNSNGIQTQQNIPSSDVPAR